MPPKFWKDFYKMKELEYSALYKKLVNEEKKMYWLIYTTSETNIRCFKTKEAVINFIDDVNPVRYVCIEGYLESDVFMM